MEQTTLGGIPVSPLGLGTSRLASLGARGSLADARRLLDAAADLGVSFIDTADTYGSTACERWLGRAMQGRAGRFVVATKCGLPVVDLPGPLRPLNQPGKKVVQRLRRPHFLDPAHITRSIERSLRRLRRERIEVYFLHSPPPDVAQSDEVFEVLDRASTAGKIGIYGVSSEDPAIILAAAQEKRSGVAQITVGQLTTAAVSPVLRSAHDANNVEFVANHVLAGRAGRDLQILSAERGVPRSHLLIRHAAALPHVRVVLTGTVNPAHLVENAAALARPPVPEDLLP